MNSGNSQVIKLWYNILVIVYLLFLAIDDCKSASGGVVQSYEDLVRNYVVSNHACSIVGSEVCLAPILACCATLCSQVNIPRC